MTVRCGLQGGHEVWMRDPHNTVMFPPSTDAKSLCSLNSPFDLPPQKECCIICQVASPYQDNLA